MSNFNNKKCKYSFHLSELVNDHQISQNNFTFDQIDLNDTFDDYQQQEIRQLNVYYLSQVSISKKINQIKQQDNTESDIAPWINIPQKPNNQKYLHRIKNNSIDSVINEEKSYGQFKNCFKNSQIQDPKSSAHKISSRKKLKQYQNKNTVSLMGDYKKSNFENSHKELNFFTKNYFVKSKQQSNWQDKQNKMPQILHLKKIKSKKERSKATTTITQNRYKDYDNQKQAKQLDLLSKNNHGSLNYKSKSCKKHEADSTLKQCTSMVNQEAKKQQCSKGYQIQAQDKQNTEEAVKKQKSNQHYKRQEQFENILSDFNKKYTQYDLIKHKILQNIKKESFVKDQQQIQANTRKKGFGKYAKNIHENKLNAMKKNTKNYIFKPSSKTQKNDIFSERKYQLNHNFGTKQLYDKFKLLVSKAV